MKIEKCLYLKDFTYPQIQAHFHLFNMDYPKMHTHDYWEFFMITSGSITHRLANGKEERLNCCDLVLIRPFDGHCLYNKSDNYALINVAVTDELVRVFTDMIDQKLYRQIIDLREPLKVKVSEQFRETLLEDANLSHAVSNNELSVMKAMIEFMYINMLKVVYKKLTFTESKHPQWLNDFLEKVRAPENITLPVGDLYKLTHFSHSHLIKLFKENMGCTLKGYMIELKMNYSAGLLRSTDMLVLEVAMHVGYNSLSHFNHAFKEFFGCSPSKFRKQYRAESRGE